MLPGESAPHPDIAPESAAKQTRLTAVASGRGAALAVLVSSLAAYVIFMRPDRQAMVDLQVYRAGGDAIRHGGFIYGFRASEANLGFTYPPFAAIGFIPLALPGLTEAKILLTVASVAAIVATVTLVLGRLGHRGRPATVLTLLITAAALWLEPVLATLSLGQINLVLMALVLGDLLRSDDARSKGIGIGIAAGIKLTPAIFVAYLLLTRRFRAGGVAVLTFLGTVAIGWAVAPVSSRTYWTELVLNPNRVGRVENSANQSIRGVLARLLHTREVQVPWLAIAAVVTGLGLGLAVWATWRRLEPCGALVCALTGLLVSPVSWSHHWVWMVPIGIAAVATALRAYRPRAPGPLVAVGALFVPFLVQLIWWPPHGNRVELTLRGEQQVLAGAYVLSGLVLLAMLAVHLGRSSRSEATVPAFGGVKIPHPQRARDRTSSPAGLPGASPAWVFRRPRRASGLTPERTISNGVSLVGAWA